MSNPYHVPAGVPEGGQFTFGILGDLAFNTSGAGWGSLETPVGKISDLELDKMLKDLAELGYTRDDLAAATPAPVTQEGLRETARSIFYDEGILRPLEEAVKVACGQRSEVLSAGGSVRGFANDDGSFHIVAGLPNDMSGFVNGMPKLKPNEAVAFNPKTGTMRQGGFLVSVGKPQIVKPGKASKAIEDFATNANSTASRQLNSEAFGGRGVVSLTTDVHGNTVIQTGILCENNEREIAEGYAKKFGASIHTPIRPGDIVNPVATKFPGAMHSPDMHLITSNRGNIQAGSDKVPASVAKKIAADAARIREARAKEKGHASAARSEKQKARDKETAKKRREEDKRAEKEIEAGRIPIRMKGSPHQRRWMFPGDLGYDEALKSATSGGGVPVGAMRSNLDASTARAAATQKRRQGRRSSDSRYRERREAQKQAAAEGKDMITFYPSGKNRVGRKAYAVEGDANYGEAMKNPTARSVFK